MEDKPKTFCHWHSDPALNMQRNPIGCKRCLQLVVKYNEWYRAYVQPSLKPKPERKREPKWGYRTSGTGYC